MEKFSRFVIIGSNCFSGSHMVDFLLRQERTRVLGISRSRPNKDIFLPYMKRDLRRFTFLKLDLNTDTARIISALDAFKPQVVINFAAQGEVATSWQYPVDWYTTNCLSLVRLASVLKDRKYLKRYVQISTPEVYGACDGLKEETTFFNPSTPYAASKAAADMFLFVLFKQYCFPLIMVRSTNVYGPHQQLYRIIPRTIIHLKKGKPVELHGAGKAIKSYIHIQDVCDGILKAVYRGRPGQLYHFSPEGNGSSVREVVKTLCSLMGYRFDSAVTVVKDRPGQDARYIIDSGLARNELGWKPVKGFEEGLREVIGWVEADWDTIRHEQTEYFHKK